MLLTPSTQTDAKSKATTFIDQLAKRDFANAIKSFDEKMKAALPADKLESTWDVVLLQAGAFKRLGNIRTMPAGDYDVVEVTCEFQKATVDVRVTFDKAGQIAGVFFLPAISKYVYPSYAVFTAFNEKDLMVGADEWTLNAALSLPEGKGPFPVVVLVHGSGPNDLDETIGANRPFRDLSLGLASNGIAVLRYNKRTYEWHKKFAAVKRVTVKDEVIDDVLSAVNVLRKEERINPRKIFVLGHSLGGELVPRIGKADPNIAGFIVMAGAARPLEDAILEQTTYIFSLDGVITKEEQARLDEIKQLVAKVKALTPADIDFSTNLYGAPPSYWLDLKGYDPPEEAKKLKQPMLVLQGERDYQVTMNEFQRWKTALSSNPRVTFKSYTKLNHLFIEGVGKSTPDEYAVAGHIPEYVITDIVQWVAAQR